MYNNNKFLLKSDVLSDEEKEQFKKIKPEMDDTTAQDAIKDLMRLMYAHCGKKVIFLLDEYDTPLQEAYMGGYCKANASQFYHGFVLGLLVELSGRYEVTSNRESGFGRYDVMLRPLNDEDDAIIMEFKIFNRDKEKSMEDTVQAALNQIEERKYGQTLIEQGIAKERIRKYGFAFEGKKVLIG